MRRRVQANKPDPSRPDAGLELCPVCDRDFVQPVDWEPVGDQRWWMFLRCAECGMSREVVVTNAQADRFERELHARASILSTAVRKLEGERMSAEIDTFVTALHRDLIDAADFAR
jgi:hypothetical protein